jgi:hypothetical protein
MREVSSDGPPALEGVVILGMHRSGTSLITRLVSLMGLALCRDDDLFVGQRPNPRGHWESKSLVGFNNGLLEECDATWFCPPSLSANDISRMLDRHASEALASFQRTHPERPWVWKDPRTCVLMPFWSAVLGTRAAYVLVVRHPLEVSDSLARRNAYSPQVSLALWERYTREAMLGAAGRPMMVCTYDGVLADPAGWCERLVAFLGTLGAHVGAVEATVAGAFTMDDLRHSRQSWTQLEPGSLLSPEQVALAEIASEFTVQRSYAPPTLPPETPGTQLIFDEIREHVARRKGGLRRLAGLPARLLIAQETSGATQAAEPPVSVVLSSGDAGVEALALTLGGTLPAGSEVLIVGAEDARASGWSRFDDVALRHIECDQQPHKAQALALGAQAARGRMVLFTTASLLHCDPWYVPLEQVLNAPERKLAGVGPVMRLQSCPDQLHYGRAFIDEDLQSHFAAGTNMSTPVPAALLFSAHCAVDRRVLSAAGGIDADFSSTGAAVAEMSVRFWRMGFRCAIVPQVEVWSENADAEEAQDEANRLYDRLRIAALHFDVARLQAFTDRARRLPAYESAATRLAASGVEQRRAELAAVCAFPIARYFERFPLGPA